MLEKTLYDNAIAATKLSVERRWPLGPASLTNASSVPPSSSWTCWMRWTVATTNVLVCQAWSIFAPGLAHKNQGGTRNGEKQEETQRVTRGRLSLPPALGRN